MITAMDFLLEEHVFLDTETTGVDDTAEIVEICIVGADGGTIVDTLVKPTVEIPDGATAVHGISDAMVASAPTWPKVWPEIKWVINGHVVGIYNAEFDTRLIRQSHIQAGMEWVPLGARALCIMKLYAKIHGVWDDHHGSYTWQSLANAAEQ